MPINQLFSFSIQRTNGMVEKLLADFSQDEMFFRPAKGANHATWQLGHVAKSGWGMLSAVDSAIRSPLSDDTRFSKDTAGLDDVSKFPKKPETMKIFTDMMQAAAAWGGNLREEDLFKPSPEQMAKFAPTLGDLAFLLAAHPTMHMGQFTVMRRALEKPVLF